MASIQKVFVNIALGVTNGQAGTWRYTPMLSNTRVQVPGTLTDIGPGELRTLILVHDVTTQLGGHAILVFKKTGDRKLVAKNYVKLYLGIKFGYKIVEIFFERCI